MTPFEQLQDQQRQMHAQMTRLAQAALENTKLITKEINDTKFCLAALMSAISRQPQVSEQKLQQDFLELCERLYRGPENVPPFARDLAKGAVVHGPAKD